MTPEQDRQQHVIFPALADELKRQGLLGPGEQPVAELWFSAHQLGQRAPGRPAERHALEVHLVPREGADPAQVDAALKLCQGWDWGPPRRPKVSLGANPKKRQEGE